jgi:hypothetical protein
MRISHKHKFVYIAVPKTASFTMRECLNPYSDIALKLIHGGDAHAKIHEVRDEYFKNEESKFTNYFKFAFVRNPWDLQVSRFHYHFKDYPEKSFKECFMDGDAVPTVQSDWLTINGEYCINFIGKYENLQQDFNVICDKIKIPKQKLPRKNASKHKHYTEYYDEETKQIVAEKYAKDIKYFGYKFGE